jgi:hypothetical protein
VNGKLKPFALAEAVVEPLAEFVSRQIARGVDPVAAADCWRDLRRCEIWKNDEYQVHVDKNPSHGLGVGIIIWHLSIKRVDREPVHDWRDLQAIKTAIAGADVEAIEIYPAEDRVVDTANQYHLFAFVADKTIPIRAPRFPLGWGKREVTGSAEAEAFGAKQRELPR